MRVSWDGNEHMRGSPHGGCEIRTTVCERSRPRDGTGHLYRLMTGCVLYRREMRWSHGHPDLNAL